MDQRWRLVCSPITSIQVICSVGPESEYTGTKPACGLLGGSEGDRRATPGQYEVVMVSTDVVQEPDRIRCGRLRIRGARQALSL
jgi:hypothetical protein